MNDTKEFLRTLISLPGLSAYETPVAEVIQERWQSLADEVRLSRVGSVEALKRGQGEVPRHSTLLAAHMDAIGLMVTEVVDGFLRVTAIGGVDARVLPGQEVLVHTGEGDPLPGVVVMPPAHLLPDALAKGPVPVEHLLVDVGLSPRQVARRVPVGARIAFATEPRELSGGVLAGHSLDNRASVAALTACLEMLQNRLHAWDLWAVATVQEEVVLLGAATSAFGLRPDLAIAVDVGFARGPGASGWQTAPYGKPLLTLGPNIHPMLLKHLQDLADELEMGYSLELAPHMSGTDAMALQVTAEGIPTAVVGMPLRYMHTPVEAVLVRDVERVGRLLAEFIARLEPDFLDKLRWDE